MADVRFGSNDSGTPDIKQDREKSHPTNVSAHIPQMICRASMMPQNKVSWFP
jgi:hypothetical protein